MRVRDAGPEDESDIRACVEAAYRIYLDRMDRPPAPVLDDYRALIADGRVRIAAVDSALVGLVVMWPKVDHLYVDNIAVHPAFQRQGIASALLVDVDRAAAEAGMPEIRLYTNEVMAENIAYYPTKGFVETHRAEDDGYRRVYFTRRTPPVES